MKKIQCYLISVLLLCALNSQCQTIEENLAKYWKYRERLKQNFILCIGEDQGCSIPASERVYNFLAPQYNKIKWGDATAHLGIYITVLATEYYLLWNNGQPTEDTVEELFWALWAFNRLDKSGEIWFGGGHDLNGFFIRDDVHINLMNSSTIFPHINAGMPNNRQVFNLESDCMDPDVRNKEMSQDQVIYILQAMAYVKKYIPSNLTYTPPGQTSPLIFQDGLTSSIRAEAMHITERLLQHLRFTSPAGWRWNIYNPVTMQKVKRGFDATALSWGFGAAYIRITGNLLLVSGPNEIKRARFAKNVWRIYKYVQAPYSTDEDFKISMLESVCNIWPDDSYISSVSIGDINNDQINISSRSATQFNFALPDFHAGLWDATSFSTGLLYWKNDLLNANRCDNIWNYSWGNYGHPSWATSSWIIHPRYNDPSEPEFNDPLFPGDFNGLDYMVIHNLHHLRMISSHLPFTHKFSPNLWFPIPINNNGTVTNPATIMSWEEITAHNIIGADSRVTYRASTYVDLEPGFTAESTNTIFEAYVDPWICDGNGNVDRIIQNNYAEETINHDESKFKKFAADDIIIYPNPSSQIITVVFHNVTDGSKVTLSDYSGKVIHESTLHSSETSMDISELKGGLYFIRSSSKVKKFIKL